MTLKTKITLVVSLLVTGLLTLMALFTLNFFERELRTSISAQQFTMISAMGDEIDRKLRTAQTSLQAAADKFPLQAISNPALAQKFLDDRYALAALFDNALFIFSSDGKLIAESPFLEGRRGRDFSFRDYFKQTVATRKPHISTPYISSRKPHPAIMLTVPVFDAKGELKAIVAGSFDLLGKNFLEELGDVKIGKTGYLYLFDTNRTMIIHPDRTRILKQDVPVGVNKLFDQAIAGFEGAGPTVTSRGQHMLSAFKRLNTTNWILASNYPEAEAYAPIEKGKRYLMAGLGAILCFSVVIVWLFMRHLTAPLLYFTRHVQGMTGTIGTPALLDIKTSDEIGTLADSFNKLIGNMAEHEKALHEQLQFSENLVQGSAVPTFVINATHQVLAWNRACEELTGITAAAVIGTDRHWQAFYPEKRPCLSDMVLDKDRGSLEGLYMTYGNSTMVPEGLAAEGWYANLNGRDRYLVFNAAPIRDSNGTIVAAIETLEDISERKMAEIQLVKLSQAVEQSPSTVIITDTEGRIEYVNPKFTQLTGYDLEEALGQTPRILKTGETPPETYQQLWDTIKSGREWRGEFHNRKKSGELYWESASISPIRNNTGEITNFIALKEDISEKKQMEEQLRHFQKMEAIGTLAAGIAHDFNNSLTAIIGYGNLINNKVDQEDPVRHYADQIIAAADKAASLTQGLLSYSRKRPVYPQPVGLNQLIQRIGKLLARLIGENIDLKIATAAAELTVQADSSQIEQIVMGLATHARDSIGGKGRLDISVTQVELDEEYISCHGYGKTGSYALLAISDNGPMLDKMTIERLFEPFFASRELGRSNGISLSIVYGMVKQHNGFINVESSFDHGTTFKVYLPLTSDPATQKPADQPARVKTRAETILLVEDSREVRELLIEELEGFGLKVLVAADGDEGIGTYREHAQEIALLLIDMVLPKKNAREVCEAARDINPDLPVIYMSGYALESLMQKGLLEGEFNFIAKPIAPEELLDLITKLLDNQQEVNHPLSGAA
jgi:PAS domain S-box-containing protein